MCANFKNVKNGLSKFVIILLLYFKFILLDCGSHIKWLSLSIGCAWFVGAGWLIHEYNFHVAHCLGGGRGFGHVDFPH